MAETRQVILPVTGMTCANCVATIERNLKKEAGVKDSIVNLSNERATVNYDPAVASIETIIKRIERAGYGIAEGELDLRIRGLSDSIDADRLKKKLTSLPGILSASVNIASETARVRYIPTILTRVEIQQAIQ
ncbi:MAG: heavy metal translocating P-type ATPase, partial [Chloroflexi bacterium]|nr:heavy metal translocating P-type ATPase [Chloroflexota bacterium]